MALYYIVLHKEAMPGRGSLQTNVADQHVLSDHRQHHPQSQGLTDVDAEYGTTEPSPETGNASYWVVHCI